MNNRDLKPSELKFLLQSNGIKNYRWKSFLSGGSFPKMLLVNTIINQEVVGKVVSFPSEGELEIWSKLEHRNLNTLLDILCIDSNNVKILISPAVGKCIGNVIQATSFVQHPLCFERKKSYAKDVLSGINYMHKKSVYLLNLSYSNVEIHAFTDKAVICDFSCAVAGKEITKSSLSSSAYYKPPELQDASSDDVFNSAAIDMWYCGLLFLQIFTQHFLPWCGILKDALNYLDSELLGKANAGACLQPRAAKDLKMFLQNLLFPDPILRVSASEAFKSGFLQTAHNRMDETARLFWNAGAGTIGHVHEPYSESNIINDETGSLYSEVDVTTISENTLQHTDASCPANKAHLVRTKSEPGVKMCSKPWHPEFRASFPTLSQKNYSINSLTSREDVAVISEIDDNLDAATFQNSLQNDRPYEYSQEDDVLQSMFTSTGRFDRSPYDVFLTEWDADFLSTNMEADSYIPYPDEIAEPEVDQLLSSSLANSLEEIPRQPILMNRLSAGYVSPAEYDAPCGTDRKISKSHKNSCGVKLKLHDDDDDGFCDFGIRRRQSDCLPLQSHGNTESNTLECTSTNFTDVRLGLPFKSSSDVNEYSPNQAVPESENRALHSVPETLRTYSRVKLSEMDNKRNQSNDIQNVSPRQSRKSPASASKSAKESSRYAQSEVIVAKEMQYRANQRNKSQNRKKWYHRLCLGFKSKRK